MTDEKAVQKKQSFRRSKKEYIVRELVAAMLRNKQLILEFSKHMDGGYRCPLSWHWTASMVTERLAGFWSQRDTEVMNAPFAGKGF